MSSVGEMARRFGSDDRIVASIEAARAYWRPRREAGSSFSMVAVSCDLSAGVPDSRSVVSQCADTWCGGDEPGGRAHEHAVGRLVFTQSVPETLECPLFGGAVEVVGEAANDPSC